MRKAVAGTARHDRRINRQERDLRKFLKTIVYQLSIERGSKHKTVCIAGKQIGVLGNKGAENDAKQIIDAVKRRCRELDAAKWGLPPVPSLPEYVK